MVSFKLTFDITNVAFPSIVILFVTGSAKFLVTVPSRYLSANVTILLDFQYFIRTRSKLPGTLNSHFSRASEPATAYVGSLGASVNGDGSPGATGKEGGKYKVQKNVKEEPKQHKNKEYRTLGERDTLFTRHVRLNINSFISLSYLLRFASVTD